MKQKIVPCLWYDSDAEDAAQFYTSIFPDSKVIQTEKYNVETPSNKPIGSVMTVEFEILDYKFIGLNGGPYFKPNPSISFHIKCGTKDEVDAIWHKLSQGGNILMPLDKYPFSERYGWIQDKYGFSWQIIFVGGVVPGKRITPVFMFVKDVCGKAEEAINLYASVFKDSSVGSILKYEKGEVPDKEGTVKYASFTLMGQEFGAMDSAHEHNFKFNEAISLIINCAGQKEINYFYEKLSAAAEAEMCGWLKDKFGVSWQVVTSGFEKLARKKEVMEALLKMKRLDVNELKKIYGKGQTMIKLNIYLNFAGNTEEAFNFYKSVFGGKFSSVVRFKDMPMKDVKIPKGVENKIMHISLPIGKDLLMATDAPESMGFKVNFGNNSYISVHPDSKKEADRIFKGLSAGGTIEMPIANQPWGDYYGSFKDKFGVQWMVNYSYPKKSSTGK